MDIYLARQPIFDKDLSVYGYELLHRKNNQNFFDQVDNDKATAEIISNVFSVMNLDDLTQGAKAFVNFSANLVKSEVPYMLPGNKIIIEITQIEKITHEIVEACRKIKCKGYSLAIDDFNIDFDYSDILDYIDVIKVDFINISIENQKKIIQNHSSKVKVLAKKIESRQDYDCALKLGYDFFQGFFFSKPVMVSEKEVEFININLINIIKELNKKETDFNLIEDIVKKDLGLSYKLLKLANSVYFGAKNQVESILEVLLRLGEKEIHKWVTLMIFKNLQTLENEEIIKLSLIRGKFIELLAEEIDNKRDNNQFFFVGIFSLIDVLLNKDMGKVLSGLSLTDSVREALLNHKNDLWEFLDCAIHYEKAVWFRVHTFCLKYKIDTEKFLSLYMKAIKWSTILNNSNNLL